MLLDTLLFVTEFQQSCQVLLDTLLFVKSFDSLVRYYLTKESLLSFMIIK